MQLSNCYADFVSLRKFIFHNIKCEVLIFGFNSYTDFVIFYEEMTYISNIRLFKACNKSLSILIYSQGHCRHIHLAHNF